MNKSQINEILGLGNTYDDTSEHNIQRQINTIVNPYTSSFDPTGPRHLLDTPRNKEDPPERQLSVWQYFFYKRLKNKDDTFMTVPPGAGKTSPILRAWNEDFLLAHKHSIPKSSPEFPRLLYIARTKQLAGENFGNNIQRDSNRGLIKTILPDPREFDLQSPDYFPNKFETIMGERLNINTKEEAERFIVTKELDDKIALKIRKDLLGISAGSITTSYFSDIYKLKCVYISTPSANENSPLLNLIRQYGEYYKYIVIDEVQDYIPRPGEDYQSKSDFDMFKLFLNIIKYAKRPGTCGVHLLSGTTNIETSEILVKDLNDCFNRNFKTPTQVQDPNNPNDPGLMFFSRDPADMYGDKSSINPTDQIEDPKNKNKLRNKFAANRSMIKVVPEDGMTSFQGTLDLVTNIVNNNQTGSIVIIFSTRRDSARGIFKLLEYANKILAPRPESLLYANSSYDKYDLNIDNTIKKYSKDHVLNKAYNPKMEPERNKKIKTLNGKLIDINEPNSIEFLKYFNVTKSEIGEGSEFYSETPDENNLVYQGALRGIGVIIGKSDNRHKEVIQRLFRDGKLTLLLATDKNCRIE